jgi:hypothetical protein
MTHPITPPPELVQQWEVDTTFNRETGSSWTAAFAARAAAWGADQELEACCEEFSRFWDEVELVTLDDVLKRLRAARRPKPPSLKELALAVLENEPEADDMKELVVFDVDQVEIIRRALEESPE